MAGLCGTEAAPFIQQYRSPKCVRSGSVLRHEVLATCAVCCKQEIDQLYKIFQVLGTPEEASWQGCTQLPDYKDTFPKWRPRQLAELVPALTPAGVDLLSRMLTYTPQHRCVADPLSTCPLSAC